MIVLICSCTWQGWLSYAVVANITNISVAYIYRRFLRTRPTYLLWSGCRSALGSRLKEQPLCGTWLISGPKEKRRWWARASSSNSGSEVTCVSSTYILLAEASHTAKPKVSGVAEIILIQVGVPKEVALEEPQIFWIIT